MMLDFVFEILCYLFRSPQERHDLDVSRNDMISLIQVITRFFKLYSLVWMFEIQLNNTSMEIPATCTVYNVLHGWSREQKNEQQNNAPNPKK